MTPLGWLGRKTSTQTKSACPSVRPLRFGFCFFFLSCRMIYQKVVITLQVVSDKYCLLTRLVSTILPLDVTGRLCPWLWHFPDTFLLFCTIISVVIQVLLGMHFCDVYDINNNSYWPLQCQAKFIADDSLFFYISGKIKFYISCESSAWQMIHMKCQDLFPLKNKNINSKCRLLPLWLAL